MLKKNILLKPYKKVSPWRKIALSMWRNQEEASFYGWIDLDATGILATIERFRSEGKSMSPTTIAAKAAAVAISQYPKVNGLIRLGRIYERENVDIFLQVAPDNSGDNLTGMVIRQCDQKSLDEISEEIQERVAKIKSGQKDDFMKSTKMLAALPTILVGWIIALISFINYTLNIWSPLLQSPRDAFGSAMVTSVGMLGLKHGIAPLIPSNRCPIIIAVGKLEEKAVVKNGEIVIQPVLPITGTFDHRLVDGVGASHLLKALKKYVEEPY
ncbi:MAG: 2-oxo acid dehydrogenase subunit E2 [Bacteroidetes bacterium]|nr:2-oxo acid dehydrogenase subunit E2 [Bacteroidota bacterium]